MAYWGSKDWRYAPKVHQTRDVVRRAIIPLTAGKACAFAASSLNRDGAQRASIMVTQNWSNLYKDLLAAVVSDALQECSFHRAPKKHISKNKDRDIPYKPPYNEGQ